MLYNATGCKNKMNAKPVKTINDIARLAGVSKSTVSRALSNSPLIGEETKAKIREIARAHNFQIHVSARRLSMQQSRTIAFITHGHEEEFTLADLFGLEMLGAISHALARNNYDFLLAHVNPYDVSWMRDYLDSGRADGFILMTSTRKQHHIQKLVEMRAPFIVWGIPALRQSYCSVYGDNLNGGRLAAEHLVQRGRRKIAFLGGPSEEMEVQHRFEGYELVLNHAGMAVNPKRVAYADFTSHGGAKAMRRLLEQAPDLDAVFANSDVMAVAAIEVLLEAGRRVPEDVAVVGYDNLSIAATSQPALTTINQNLPLVGQLLAENLIRYLENGVVTNVTVPVELLVRKST